MKITAQKCLSLVVASFIGTNSFSLLPCNMNKRTSTSLSAAFNKRNKQGDLMKKMQEARRQREIAEDTAAEIANPLGEKKIRKTDEEIKRENDMKRFEQLLNSESATINYDIDGKSGNYLTKQQEEEEINAGYKGIDRIFEGDPAKEDPFHDLVMIENENALGANGAKRLLPWLNKNSDKQTDYLVIVSDPRPKSSELRTAMRSMVKLPPNILSKSIVINADTPAENRKFLKKQGLSSLNIYCDEKREWMREYTALGEKRWAMCMFVIAEGRVQRLVREMDVDTVGPVIQNAVKSLKQ